MDSVLGIFQSVISKNEDVVDLYLDALRDHQSFSLMKTGSSDVVVQLISSLLSKVDTRPLGLKIFNSFLKQCPKEVIEKKGDLWTTLTLKACNPRELENNASDVFNVLKRMAIHSRSSPDLIKSFSSNHLSKIYEALANLPPQGCLEAFDCIETCLTLYPGASGPSRGVVERFLLRYMDTVNAEINRRCGKCHQMLLQVRGGGAHNVNHKNLWFSFQAKLLKSLDNTLNQMFPGLYDSLPDNSKENDDITLENLSCDPVDRAMQLYIRFRNLTVYLILALCEPYPVEKLVAPKKILDLLCRGLEITCLTLQQSSTPDSLAMAAILPKIHLHLLELLQALILSLTTHLKTYHYTILSILQQVLKWTSWTSSNVAKKPFLTLRTKVYDTMNLWCSVTNSGSCAEIFAEFFVQEIFNDISPAQSQITLKVLSGARHQMSKKARRQLHKAQNEQSNLSQQHSSETSSAREAGVPDEETHTLCMTALKCLKSLLSFSSNAIKPNVMKTIQSKIIKICGLFYEFPLKQHFIYTNWKYRYEIHEVLFILIRDAHSTCPPPAEIIFSILQTGSSRDSNALVRSHCGEILMNLEKLLHPQKETLLFPIDIRKLANTIWSNESSSMVQTTFPMESVENESDDDDDGVEQSQTISVVDTNAEEAEDDFDGSRDEPHDDDEIASKSINTRNEIPTVVEGSDEDAEIMQDDGLRPLKEAAVRISSGDDTNDEPVEPLAKKSKILTTSENDSNSIEKDSTKQSENSIKNINDESEDLIIADIASSFVIEFD